MIDGNAEASPEKLPKVTFGMIVLNGMPFLPYNLRALYPFAHQIVVVEGAVPGAAGIASSQGHSRDGTLTELRRFAREEDPEGKLIVVTAETDGHHDGFWPGEKDEQSRAYAVRATGDYLWQVDVDEFYLPVDMESVLKLLAADASITAVSFPTRTFWGAPWCVVDGWYLRRGAATYHRLFKWGRGYAYSTHRPPTVVDDRGRDVRTLHWLDAGYLERRNIVMYHYSLLLPAQVREKVDYYSHWGVFANKLSERQRWLSDSFFTLRKPYRVHNVFEYPSWLLRFNGPHPPEVLNMLAALDVGDAGFSRRPMADVERLLRSPIYLAGREVVKICEPVNRRWWKLRRFAGRFLRRMVRGLTLRKDQR